MVNFDYLQSIGGEQLSQSCPSLLYLILDADRVAPDDEEMLDQLTEWIEEYLPYATKLDCLTIRFYPQLSQTPCHEIDFSDMITSVFAASKKLTHVIVTFLGYTAKYVCKREPGRDWYIVDV
ncbi:hypothetical protein NLJ89_g5496 [Agrocybe chaxingu]|uniref:Uncharacterized protein n=1 Tax=Agrocybe chaxingu TaxID=84603 RepID=A0A9W8K2A4_9AGAR|nr:hypothetical protein NLJ89_g5496 [Agrocybe chaxingu]